MSKLIELSESLAEEFHGDQFDLAYRPQMVHIRRVVKNVEDAGGNNYEIAAAYLHDSFDDAGITTEILRKRGVPKPVVEIVDALTKREGESSRSFMKRVAENSDAILVQRAIIEDNTRPGRINKLDLLNGRRIKNKYEGYSRFLDEAIAKKEIVSLNS